MGEWRYAPSNIMTMLVLLTVMSMRDILTKGIIEMEKDVLTLALGHEPTMENWQTYYDLLEKQQADQKTNQGEVDREKLYQLVMGKKNAA